MTALFTPLDMTDHETDFVGWNEMPGALPLDRPNWLAAIAPEPMPVLDAYSEREEIEDIPRYGTSETMKAFIVDKYADIEPDDDQFYGSEGDEEEEEYGEEGEEGEEGGEEEEYGDYDEEEETEPWPPLDSVKSAETESRFFRAGESLRGKYSEVELEQFMKLLGVKPSK
jgi:hypothetical protein